MANIFQPKNRRVIPNFRSFTDTVELGELAPATTALASGLSFQLDEQLNAWADDKTIGTAGDLLSAAVVAGCSRDAWATEAARFVLTHREQAPLALLEMAEKILAEGAGNARAPELPRLSAFVDSSAATIGRRLGRVRRLVNRFPSDALQHVEMARLHSILGHREKALREMRIALALGPDSRFVLRSAARLLAHHGQPENAYALLASHRRTPHDPWLAAAELALANVVGKHPLVIKRAKGIAGSQHFSSFSLTELNSGLATIELLEGQRRKSRKLFTAALEAPNDNSLAQTQWAFSHHDRLFDVDASAYGVRRNYEALALEAFGTGDWKAVVEQCESWFLDMPFQKRPVMLASHVATVVLQDYRTAELFCRAGLLSHPDDPQLLNNLAYALALDGNPGSAAETLSRIAVAELEDVRGRVCVIATEGLIHYRKGELDAGRSRYEEAIQLAKTSGETHYANVALLNFAREELVAGGSQTPVLMERVANLKADEVAATFTVERDRLLAMYERSRSGSTPR